MHMYVHAYALASSEIQTARIWQLTAGERRSFDRALAGRRVPHVFEATIPPLLPVASMVSETTRKNTAGWLYPKHTPQHTCCAVTHVSRDPTGMIDELFMDWPSIRADSTERALTRPNRVTQTLAFMANILVIARTPFLLSVAHVLLQYSIRLTNDPISCMFAMALGCEIMWSGITRPFETMATRPTG